MKTSIAVAIPALATSLCFATDTPADRVATVMNTPGCVAFWDFVKREPDGGIAKSTHQTRVFLRIILILL